MPIKTKITGVFIFTLCFFFFSGNARRVVDIRQINTFVMTTHANSEQAKFLIE